METLITVANNTRVQYIKPFRNPRQGFTLVELLVVISIIAVLMSIMMPALGMARSQGRSTVCLSNVRRIGVAGLMYANEYGAFPPFRVGDAAYVNDYGRTKPRWQWFFDQGVGPVIDPKPYAGKPSFGDSDTLMMTNDYFICPSFNYPQYDKRDIRNGSYGYNWQYLGNSRIVGRRYENFPVRTSRVANPGRTVLVGDSRGGDVPHGKHSYTLDPPKLASEAGATMFGASGTPFGHSPASARHRNSANISFVDGHASSISLVELGYILDRDGNVIPNHPDGSNSLWKAVK